MDKRIGLIGLGIMGKPMARNLLKAGYPLTVYSRGRSAVEALLADGAAGARSSQEVAERSDVVITMVTDTPDVRQVILGEHSVLTGMQVGGIIIDMSTISPSVTREIAEVVKAKGVHFLDAPVSGGEGGAMAGTLSIMVGGEAEVFTTCLPIFQAMGKNIIHVGGTGTGQLTKLCNQIAVAVTNRRTCDWSCRKLTGCGWLCRRRASCTVSLTPWKRWERETRAPKLSSKCWNN